MADYLIRARIVEHKGILGRVTFTASVDAIPMRSSDPAPTSGALEEPCESREQAREANQRLIEKLSRDLSGRGDKVLGVSVEC